MRKLLRYWVALCALALPLMGAGESPYGAPVVVVYPITTAGKTASDAGSQIALLLSARLAQLGGITVKPFTPGTTRADFLTAAVAQLADYYVTGYLTPVGSDVSFVAQVVSTRSGSIVYSSTALVHTYGDAVAQAEALHDAILHHAGRGLAALDAPRPQPTVSPTPARDAGINISKAFGRRRGRHAAAPPSPSAAPAAPTLAAVARVAPAGTTALVIETGGNGDDADRTYAASALSAALDRSGLHSGVVSLALPDVAAHATDLCRLNPGVAAFYAGTLGLERPHRGGTSVAYDVRAYDCNAALVGHERIVLPAGAGSIRTTIDRAVAQAVTDLHVAPKPAAGTPSVIPASPPATS